MVTTWEHAKLFSIKITLRHSVRMSLGVCPGASFKNTMRKLRSIAFQPCISWGVNVVIMGQINDFIQILGLKTPISAETFLDHLTLEGAGTPNFKSTDIFDMFPENLGAKAFR